MEEVESSTPPPMEFITFTVSSVSNHNNNPSGDDEDDNQSAGASSISDLVDDFTERTSASKDPMFTTSTPTTHINTNYGTHDTSEGMLMDNTNTASHHTSNYSLRLSSHHSSRLQYYGRYQSLSFPDLFNSNSIPTSQPQRQQQRQLHPHNTDCAKSLGIIKPRRSLDLSFCSDPGQGRLTPKGVQFSTGPSTKDISICKQNKDTSSSPVPTDPPLKSILVPQSRQTRTPQVKFSTIEIRSYERILGDNPSCSSGPSISIGWHYDPEKTCVQLIDEYEYRRTRRLEGSDMTLSKDQRFHLLVDLGYSRREISHAVRSNLKLKKKRRQTVNNLPIRPVEEIIEGVSKKFSVMMKKRISSKHLYDEWKGSAQEIDLQNGRTRSSDNDVSRSSSSRRSSLKSSTKISLSTVNRCPSASKVESSASIGDNASHEDVASNEKISELELSGSRG